MASSFGGMVGSIIQMGAAKKAQKAQERAAQQQMGLFREIFDYSKDIQAPFVDAGTMANAILQHELWGAEAPSIQNAGFEVGGATYGTREEAENALKQATQRFNRSSMRRVAKEEWRPGWGKDPPPGGPPVTYETRFDPTRGIKSAGFDPRQASVQEVDPIKYGGFQKTPDYQFAFSEGQNAVTSSAAARGGLKSGATLKALTEYGQNFAGLRRDNYINQLMGMQGSGQASTNALQSAGNAYAHGSSGALAAMGNAQAAGAIARGNYSSQAFQHGVQGVGQIAGMFGGGGGFGSIASQFLGSGGFG